MGAQTKGNMEDPRQRQMVNEGIRMRRENARSNQEESQEQEVGIDNYGREQQQRAQEQTMNERMQQQAMAERMQQQRAENTPTPGSGIAFGPGRSNRGDVDLRRLLQDRMTRGN
tara:strand:+ start:6712 stop:7053 length:342 start_codon:yes stop_codon:yes gene_type:complete